MATISSLGSGSGLDLNSLLTNLMSAEQAPMLALQKKEASFQARISSLGSLQSALAGLQSAANGMTPAIGSTASSKFSTPQASVADTTVAYATADTNAVAASYSLTVTTLAQAQRLVSPAYGVGSSATTAIGQGTLTLDFGKLSTTTTPNDTYTADTARNKTITIDGTNNTLGGLRDAINASGADVTATIVTGSAGAQLVLTGKTTGVASLMRLTTTGTLSGLDYTPVSGGSGTLSDTAPGGQVAADAAYAINGIAGSGSSNTVTGMIEGVTLNLTKQTTSATTVTVTKDNTSKLTVALNAFVKAYNDAVGTMGSLGAYDATTKKAGALQGNSTLLNAQSQVRDQLFNVTSGGSSPYQRLSDIGVSLGKDGKLSLDTAKLNSAVTADYATVASLVGKVGKAYQTATDNIIGTGGSIPTAVASANGMIGDNKARQAALTTRLTAIETRYRKQFTSLDSLIAGMKQTSTYLTQQLASLPGVTSKSN